jgi:hypothetical protein
VIARVIHHEGEGGDMPDTAVANINETVLPRLREQPGFVAGYWLMDDNGVGMTVVIWEDAESDAANEAKIEGERKETLSKAGRRITKNQTQKVRAHSHASAASQSSR